MATVTRNQGSRRYIDGPAPYTTHEPTTGLLTRFVPSRLRTSSFYRLLLRLTRVLQFLSSIISLGVFTQRFYKVYRLVNSIKTRRGVNGSYGAVEGILAAAVLYTLITTILGLIKKSANPGGRILRWIWVLLDVLFVGAFIAVTVLTRPNGGLAGARHCYGNRSVQDTNNLTGETANTTDDSCDLPWGTFILAIISTILHAITASFHEIRERRHARVEEKGLHQKSATTVRS
ncbi:hypothetical protein B0J11DRAFT_603778 [Dendryphion nanum]|uniref:MARVEL domain-containing protein n=1 Tax=Dendryphion nanum TaxID=256645 RepID=A0A9P9IQ64_9PLEO|nr:hypothetical protein B0J11DRAFT_603778 [Dendryphion nanum]